MISSVRNALPDLDAGRRGANHRYYVHTYTLHLPSLSLSVMCIWKFGAVSKLCSEKKTTQGIHKFSYQNYNNILGGEMMNEARQESRRDVAGILRLSPLLLHLSLLLLLPLSLCKLNKMPEASEKASRVDLSRLLVDPTWLKSNLIKCIAGILRK